MTLSLRERQAPLKAKYEADPESAKLTIVVHSTTTGDDPTKVQISADAVDAKWDAAAHPYAGGDGELACSGDLLLGSLAACQEITLRMVAAAMGITIERLDLTVEGDMDFRGTMGMDRDAPVGFTTIRTKIGIAADAPEDRLQRLMQRAERYCVVASTLKQSPAMETHWQIEPAAVSVGDAR